MNTRQRFFPVKIPGKGRGHVLDIDTMAVCPVANNRHAYAIAEALETGALPIGDPSWFNLTIGKLENKKRRKPRKWKPQAQEASK